MESGIYKIKHINGKIYIGSSSNIKKRLSYHKSALKCNNHNNKRLQNAYNKYGLNLFIFEPIEFCEVDMLIQREQFYINSYDKKELFNIRLIAESNKGIKGGESPLKGIKISEERRTAISKSLIGNKRSLGYKHTEECKQAKHDRAKQNPMSQKQRNAISLFHKGKINSKETIEKIRIAKSNSSPISEETKLKMSNAAKNRPKISEETRTKLTNAVKARGIKPETRLKMAVARTESNKLKRELGLLKRSDETKQKISNALRTRGPISEETRIKMRAAAILRMEKRKLKLNLAA